MNEINNDDNDKFVLAPELLLYQTISEYGIDPGEWTQKIWLHIYEDFMDCLEKAGYVRKEDV